MGVKVYRIGRHAGLGGWLLALGLMLTGHPASAATGLVFAVHPYLAGSEIEQRFAPLARRLSRDIGLPITLRVSPNYDAHIQAVGQGLADLAYIGPAELLLVEARFGRRHRLGQIVFSDRRWLSGHLVTRQPPANPAASSAERLASLRGQRIAFVDRQSTMGYLVPIAVLRAAGIHENEFESSKFVGSHDNVALGVLAGEFQVGAVKDETFEKYRRQGLYSLLEMPLVPEHVFVASPRIPAEWQRRLQQALFGLADDDEGKAVLHAIRDDVSKIVPVDGRAFDALRQRLGFKAPTEGRP